MDQLMNLFTNTETPFALLFVALFIFYVRDSKARENQSKLTDTIYYSRTLKSRCKTYKTT